MGVWHRYIAGRRRRHVRKRIRRGGEPQDIWDRGVSGRRWGAYAGDDKESCGKVTDQADTSSQMEEVNVGNNEHIPKRPAVRG